MCGLTPDEARRITPRELDLQMQARARTERVEWRRTLAIVNTVIGIMDGDPITLEDLKERGQSKKTWTAEDEQGLVERFRGRGLMVPN